MPKRDSIALAKMAMERMESVRAERIPGKYAVPFGTARGKTRKAWKNLTPYFDQWRTTPASRAGLTERWTAWGNEYMKAADSLEGTAFAQMMRRDGGDALKRARVEERTDRPLGGKSVGEWMGDTKETIVGGIPWWVYVLGIVGVVGVVGVLGAPYLTGAATAAALTARTGGGGKK